MAASNSINQRIVLTGADEVRRHLDEIAAAGQRAGNTTRAALQAATGNLNTFTAGARNAGTSAGQMRFALQNLSFQVNDVATSLASGGDIARVASQQFGQIVQAVQQGGGLGNVLTAIGSGVSAMVTPMRLAAAGAVALAAGLGAIVLSAESSQDAIRLFDVQLKAVGNTTGVTGKALDDAAHHFKDVGLSTAEARKALSQGISQGISPNLLTRVLRVGAELNTVLGEGSLQGFTAAFSQGGPALDAYAKRLSIVTAAADDASTRFDALNADVKALNKTLDDEARNRSRAIAEQNRDAAQQIKDLTRVRGTPKQEIELAARRAIEKINRDSQQKVLDDFREFNQKRHDENEKALAAFNKQTADAAQKAANDIAILSQLEGKVLGATRKALGPLGQAIQDARIAFSNWFTELANSTAVQTIVAGMADMVRAITAFVEKNPEVVAAIAAFVAALGTVATAFAVARVAAIAFTAAAGPVGLVIALVAATAALIDLGKAWDGAKAAADGAWTLLKAVGAWLSDTFVGLVNDFLIGPIKSVWDWFQRLIDKAKEVAQAIGGIFGGIFGGGNTTAGQNPSAQSGAGPGGFAAGTSSTPPGTILVGERGPELISQPGGLSVWSNQQTQRIMSAFNSLNMPIMPRARRFATGTFGATATGGGVPVHVHIGSKSFGPMMTDRQIAEGLRRFAASASIRSAGKKPSTS